jgi:hypothetical protein
MNVEIGAQAALFPEKKYIKGIFVAVYPWISLYIKLHPFSIDRDIIVVLGTINL